MLREELKKRIESIENQIEEEEYKRPIPDEMYITALIARLERLNQLYIDLDY